MVNEWTRLVPTTLRGEPESMEISRGEVALKSAARTFIFAVLAALYTQFTANNNSTLKEYLAVAGAALLAAITKGVTAFFSAKSLSVR